MSSLTSQQRAAPRLRSRGPGKRQDGLEGFSSCVQPDGEAAAIKGDDRTARLWDASSAPERHPFTTRTCQGPGVQPWYPG
jgi:WD40 repeat protein